HFVTLCTGFAVAYVPFNFLMKVFQLQPGSFDWGKLMRMLTVILVFATIFPLLQLAATISIADAYLSKPTSFGSAFARARKLYLPYLGTSFLVMIAGMLLMILLVVPGVYFLGCWILVGPVAVVEGVF